MKELIFGVKELQANLSTALRAAQAGRRVVITSHNRPIAEISSPKTRVKKMSALDRKLERLFQKGTLIRPKKQGPIPIYKGFPMPGLLEQFLADRR